MDKDEAKKDCCGTCAHYYKTGLQEGCCRKDPPQMVPVQMVQVSHSAFQVNGFLTMAPSPKADWLCSHYKPATPKTDEMN